MNGIESIAAERQRQIEKEGWTSEHDDCHHDGSLADAAACYAMPLKIEISGYGIKLLKPERETEDHYNDLPIGWPSSWNAVWWKPKSYREDLVRAGARS